MSSPSGYSARASSSSSSSSTSSSTTPSSLWSSFTRASARTGFSPLALTASSFLAAAGGFALAWALLRERLLRRDAPRGEEGGNLSEVFRALREAHARRKKRREAAKNASNAASSSSASAATALSDDDVIIRAPTPADIDAITLQTHDAFNEWNASVGLPKEWPSMDFCKWVMSSCITEPTSFGLAAFHARTNECLGSVFNEECDIVDGAVGCGPWSAKWGALQQGVGRRLVEEIVAQSIRHGAKSIRLNQIAANLTSYSLYSSLGFVTREVYTVWCGAISTEASSEAIRAGEALGYTVRPMTESDVPACDALHQAALGISRKALLTKGVTAGDGFMPLTVVMDKNGEIIGYNTGLTVVSHSIVRCPIAFRFLIATVTESTRSKHAESPPFLHTCSRLYPEIDRWLLQSGVRMHRVNNLMVLGEWRPIAFENYIYAPSIEY